MRPVRALLLWFLLAAPVSAQPDAAALARRPWFEARTAHFHTYSCGPTQEVARVAARLEQFREAYSMLAGAEAVASPPIVVMAFPDHPALKPFLPVYQSKPANLEAFFNRGSDENLIALPLSESGSLEVVFHEYTHLLMRHNDQFWPMWLKEGMAEIYGTFAVNGPHSAQVGLVQPRHVRLLSNRPLMPLKTLLSVTHESPEYNQREHQGVFYAESWLLTHYLMLGGNEAHKAHFSQLTALLRQGQKPEQAFTNAFKITLPVMENELRQYVARAKFQPLALTVSADLTAPRAMATRGLAPVEVWFRLGDQLLRVGQLDRAAACFAEAQSLAPASPLPFEGLGLLAAERDQSQQAVHLLGEAIKHGSASFLAHYVYAREKFKQSADAPGRHTHIEKGAASEIATQLKKSLALMGDFGPAHHLLGVFEIIQGEDFGDAVRHLKRAIQLEPEHPDYLLSLAQAQFRSEGPAAARRTLELLCLPYIEPDLRANAQELLKELSPAQR